LRKKLLRYIGAIFLPFIAQLLIRLIYRTCKVTYTLPNEPKEPYIVAFWHGELLLQPYIYRRMRDLPRIGVMISDHFDGELIARTIAYFGFTTLRGSSSKRAASVLLEAIRKMKAGFDVAITPDGPRGPRHSVADGIIAIAQKMDAQIVVQHVRPSRYWQLRSWDRFMIPKPFSEIELIAMEPFKVTGMDKEDAKILIKKKMLLNAV